MFSKDLGARIRELQSGHSVSISAVTVSSEGRARYLECDEVCAQEERNRRLAAALEIDNPNISPMENEVQYSAFLLEQARYNICTCMCTCACISEGSPHNSIHVTLRNIRLARWHKLLGRKGLCV